MHSPLVKNIAFPLHEKLLKRPTIQYVNKLEKSQWFNRADVELLQRQKLNQLLQLAIEHCPWHKQRILAAQLDLSSDNLLTLNDLTRIPTMSKQDAQIHGKDMTWTGVPGGAYPYTTGGSSGTPLNFHFGKWRQASDAAGRIRARRWWGVDLGDKEVYLWGAPVELEKTDKIKKIREGLCVHELE